MQGKYVMQPQYLFCIFIKTSNHEKLPRYAVSKQLAIEIHKITLSLPKFELFEEGSQIRRSSKSVTSSIVEGYGRKRYKADFIKFLVYAHSECDETIIHLDFLFETQSLKDQNIYKRIREDYESLSKKINVYIQWVSENLNEFPISKT